MSTVMYQKEKENEFLRKPCNAFADELFAELWDLCYGRHALVPHIIFLFVETTLTRTYALY